MENISLIASIICAITALTTSLRGLARSRDFTHHDIETLAGARLPAIKGKQSFSASHNLFVYRLSTIIWFVLAVVFALPTLLRFMDEVDHTGILLWTLSSGLLAVIILLIWRRVKT